jgi:Zn-dependent peptidase ImmA (M78 family)
LARRGLSNRSPERAMAILLCFGTMRRWLAPLLLVLIAAGPDPAAHAQAPQPQAALPRSDLDKLLASTDEIAKIVSEIRQLPLKRKIARGVMGKPEITRRLMARIDEDYAPAEIAAEEKALKLLGLLPADASYRDTVLALLTEQVAGFYDPNVRELYIADWIALAMQRMVMAHEIGHALQDQSFDLLRFTKPNRENGDEQLARQALVEGDGVALMIEFMFREMGLKQDPWADDTIVNTIGATSGVAGGELFDKAPPILKETLLFPYRDGLRLIARARRTRPWSDIDAMYARPPLSTEQVLHPQKYRDGEKPVALRTPPLPSLKAWKRVYSNVIGELVFSILLRQHDLEPGVAERAAAGWGGDRVFVFEPPDATQGDGLLIDLSAWDTEMDAIEATEALGRALPAAIVERRGKLVLLLVGLPASLSKLPQEIWARWKA